MKFPGFCGPSYTSQSLSVDAQKLMNWYLEKIESGDGNTDFALYPSPGTKTFVDLTVAAFLFQEMPATIGGNISGPCFPSEIAWTNPGNIATGTPGTYATASLNGLSGGGSALLQAAVGNASSGDPAHAASCTLTLGANHFVVLVAIGYSNPGLNFTETLGLSQISIGQISHFFAGSANHLLAMVAYPTGAGGTDTFTVSSAGFNGGYAIAALEYSGVPSGPAVVAPVGAFGQLVADGNISSGNITTTIPDLVVGASLVTNSGIAQSVGAGFTLGTNTLFNNAGIGGSNNFLMVEDILAAPPSNYAAVFGAHNTDAWLALVAGFQISPPTCSQALRANNFGLTIPPGATILGIAAEIGGHQTNLAPDILLFARIQLPDGTLSPTILSGQLPSVDGVITLGGPTQLWALALTPALVNNPLLTVYVFAEAEGGEVVEFDVYSVKAKVYYA